jgi:transcriptional regulator with XRE-family HTH domain
MNKMKTFREKHKITQTELAKVLNTSQKQISMYETGKRKLNEDQIATLIKVYHAEIGDLLELEDMEKKRNATK